jgi:hypothetical protein
MRSPSRPKHQLKLRWPLLTHLLKMQAQHSLNNNHIGTIMTNDMTKHFTDAAEKMKQFVPQVSFNKNGYEIRAQVLEMAKDLAQFEYSAKFQAAEVSAKRDPTTNALITKVEFPSVPGVDQILASAEKFYAFVNKK